MNISDYNKAKCLEENFNTVINYRYSRSISGEPLKVFQELCKTYNIHLNTNCNQCVFNALEKLGTMYLDFKKSLVSEPVKPAQAKVTESETETTESIPESEPESKPAVSEVKPKIPKKPIETKPKQEKK